jgi:hypothetical protein
MESNEQQGRGRKPTESYYDPWGETRSKTREGSNFEPVRELPVVFTPVFCVFSLLKLGDQSYMSDELSDIHPTSKKTPNPCLKTLYPLFNGPKGIIILPSVGKCTNNMRHPIHSPRATYPNRTGTTVCRRRESQ